MLFDAIQQTPNLRSGLVETLIAQIESGDLAPGQRLPTEQAIVAATGVSRTVVREALASLRAKGLITTRQGLGAFVVEGSAAALLLHRADRSRIRSTRCCACSSCAWASRSRPPAFAAPRRTDEDLERMAARLDALEPSIRAGGVRRRKRISAFTARSSRRRSNSYFARLLDTFGSAMIPRQWVPLDRDGAARAGKYVARMQREHRAILAAIRDGNERGASRAMRTHLTKSYARFEELRDRTGRVSS